MAEKRPTSSSSRRPRDVAQPDMAIGTYRRLEEIGRGSFATVYKASVSKQPGFVAIKSVDVHRLNKKLKENLYSEIHILKGLHHPHIVALIDCKEDPSHIHLIMEFCELGDLSYFIKKRDSLNLHETMKETIRKYPNPPGGGLNEVIVRHLLKQLADAMHFLRDKNFIHRDVKPQNLLLDPSPHYYATVKPAIHPFMAHEKSSVPNVGIETLPTLKLADFGFARSLPSTSLAETLCGSPLYMAPEILRYEKYDARVDLWSIGTVLYEMLVGRPPFKASNHVELLRKIERGEDRIRFPDEIYVSSSLKKLIRGLLRRNPAERMSFDAFFNDTVNKDEIPGLTDDDRTRQLPLASFKSGLSGSRPGSSGRSTSQSDRPSSAGQSPSSGKIGSSSPKTDSLMQNEHRRLSGTPPRAPAGDLREKRTSVESMRDKRLDTTSAPRRPSMTSHATAPARQDLHTQTTRNAATVAMERKSSKTTLSSQEKAQQREKAVQIRQVKERAAQDVAFERDYVLVEKRAVEVNAFADELAASPRVRSANQQEGHRGTMVRRATHQGASTAATGAQVTPSRAMQIVSGKRPDASHQRMNSYERRLRDPASATSAISKAINLASGRLFSMGLSPPLNLGRGAGSSPPMYSAFPAYPIGQGSLLMIEDGPKRTTNLDEDARTLKMLEESATRADVVFGFAEVKYKQLIPLAPDMDYGLGLHVGDNLNNSASAGDDMNLTVEARMTLSEEALVLFVKTLSILARCMDIAGTWWARKNRGDVVEESALTNTPSRRTSSTKLGNRVNNVVQWVREHFNMTLEKAEFVRLKLLEAQRQLPLDHPSHPSNHPAGSSSSGGLDTSSERVIVTSGVTAEKLMYDRALEMSRSAAVNELVGEDLPGCDLAYVTAVRLLEAVLESDDDAANTKTGQRLEMDRDHSVRASAGEPTSGVEEEDREIVAKLVTSIRSRLAALRKKVQALSSTNRPGSAPHPPAAPSRSHSHAANAAPTRSVNTTIATTPP